MPSNTQEYTELDHILELLSTGFYSIWERMKSTRLPQAANVTGGEVLAENPLVLQLQCLDLMCEGLDGPVKVGDIAQLRLRPDGSIHAYNPRRQKLFELRAEGMPDIVLRKLNDGFLRRELPPFTRGGGA